MAENSTGGATPWLAFVVGGLVVLVVVIGYFVISRGSAVAPAKSLDVRIETPQLPDAPKLPDAPIPQPK